MVPTKLDWYSIFLHLVLVGLAVAVLLLVRENRALREVRVPSPQPQLEIGEFLEPLAVIGLDGRESTLDFSASGDQSVLMVFTTRCPYCLQNQDAWKELHARLEDRFRVLGIGIGDLDTVKSYAETQELSYPVVVPVDAAGFPRRYKIPGVPATVLVGADGRVEQYWSGLLDDDFYDDFYDVLEEG